MPITAIMVHVDFDDETAAHVVAAADLARRFDATLIGIAGWVLRKGEAGSDVTQERSVELLEHLGDRFRKLAGDVPAGIEWQSSCHFPREVISNHAVAADLIVIGRTRLPGDLYGTFDPGEVILAAGRPVLVLPPDATAIQASRIVIAWKNTREARRAVSDAIPFLRAAQAVSIAVVCEAGMETAINEQVAELPKYLARHKVASATPHIIPVNNAREERVLLEFVKAQNADLIVAGAYGHTRLSEWIFGGFTRHLLTTSTVPCLFSG